MEKLKYDRVLVVSDNLFLIKSFHQIIEGVMGVSVDYCCSPGNTALLNGDSLPVDIKELNVKKDFLRLGKAYNLILSLHCKQLFPPELVSTVKCINVHPGFNPYNRGWFPQVFSILNNLPCGATIHEIDDKLDHGNIIARRQIPVHSWDTSIDIYNRVQQLEVELIKENLGAILTGTYRTEQPEEEGNVNLKKDFNVLCKLDLDEPTTMGGAINRLRALTHGSYANAYYTDSETGKKVFVKIEFKKED